MQEKQISTEALDLVQIISTEGVLFNPDDITLQGYYLDELSAHRAKRLWIDTLENTFILEQGYDFFVKARAIENNEGYLVECEFVTACARYAFWRLTNNQAPEAQYIIETAHIPICESRHEEILKAPDMRSVYEQPVGLAGTYRLSYSVSLLKQVQNSLKTFLKTFK